MEFPEEEEVEDEAHVLSNKKINAIATYILRADTCDGYVRDQFVDVSNKMCGADPSHPYDKIGDALFAMNVEAVQQNCAKYSMRLRGRVMPHYKSRAQNASLIYVYDAVKELQKQCEVLYGDTLFGLLYDLRQAVADDIIETNRKFLEEKRSKQTSQSRDSQVSAEK